jgi:hypothetical protein
VKIVEKLQSYSDLYGRILELQQGNLSASQDIKDLLCEADRFVQTSKDLAGKEKLIKLRHEQETDDEDSLQQLKAAAIAYANANTLSQRLIPVEDAPKRVVTPRKSKFQSFSETSYQSSNLGESPLFEPKMENTNAEVGNSKSSRAISLYILQFLNEIGLERKNRENNPHSDYLSNGKRVRKLIERPGMVSTIENVPSDPLSHGKKHSKSRKRPSIPTTISEAIMPETHEMSEIAAEDLHNLIVARRDGKGNGSAAPRDSPQLAVGIYQAVQRARQSDSEGS